MVLRVITDCLLPIAAYVGVLTVILRIAPQRIRMPLFALVNLAFLWWFYFASGMKTLQLMGLYVLIVLIFYGALHLAGKWIRLYPVAFLLPILFLVGQKSLPWYQFVGISYLTFRLSYLVAEVRNRQVAMPDVWSYLGFAFFLPLFCDGPHFPLPHLFCHARKSRQKLFPPGAFHCENLCGSDKVSYPGKSLFSNDVQCLVEGRLQPRLG